MIAMLNAPYVIGRYIVTFGGIGLYALSLFTRARKAARQVAEDDLPWR